MRFSIADTISLIVVLLNCTARIPTLQIFPHCYSSQKLNELLLLVVCPIKEECARIKGTLSIPIVLGKKTGIQTTKVAHTDTFELLCQLSEILLNHSGQTDNCKPHLAHWPKTLL